MIGPATSSWDMKKNGLAVKQRQWENGSDFDPIRRKGKEARYVWAYCFIQSCCIYLKFYGQSTTVRKLNSAIFRRTCLQKRWIVMHLIFSSTSNLGSSWECLWQWSWFNVINVFIEQLSNLNTHQHSSTSVEMEWGQPGFLHFATSILANRIVICALILTSVVISRNLATKTLFLWSYHCTAFFHCWLDLFLIHYRYR